MNDFLPYINTGLLTIMSIGAGFVTRKLSQVESVMRDLCNRTAILETDFKGHEKWCGEDSSRNDREHGEMRNSLETTRQSLHGLRNEAFKMALRNRVVPTTEEDL